MNERKSSAFQVIDENGLRGTIDLTVIPKTGSDSRLVLVRFDDGSQVFADAGTFTELEEGVFAFPGSFAQLIAQTPTNQNKTKFERNEIIIPVLAEELKIARQKVLTGGVRVHKTVTERTATISEPTLQEQISVERIPVNQYISEPPAVRYEGDVMIVPVLEEVMVVEKRLVLREEIRITKTQATVQNPQQIILRREEATLEKIAPEAETRADVSGATQTTRKP